MQENNPICVVEICKGFCCNHISEGFAKMLTKFVTLVPNNEGELKCINVADDGKCMIYKNRPLACKLFFCESAEKGYMRKAMRHIDNPTISEVVF